MAILASFLVESVLLSKSIGGATAPRAAIVDAVDNNVELALIDVEFVDVEIDVEFVDVEFVVVEFSDIN